MRVLIVKLTSMGDVLHLMPALNDLHQHQPQAKVDWLVEDSFSDIPAWHPAVNKILKASTRRWRKFDKESRKEYGLFKIELQKQKYDVVIDAQGLIKSAWIARKAKLAKGGIYAGFSGRSIKESPASLAYNKKINVDRQQHAVTRLRQLFAGVFKYSISENENLWEQVASLIVNDGYKVKVCWGNEQEHKRAKRIAEVSHEIEVLPKSTINELAQQLQFAKGAISVDTGLGHYAEYSK